MQSEATKKQKQHQQKKRNRLKDEDQISDQLLPLVFEVSFFNFLKVLTAKVWR